MSEKYKVENSEIPHFITITVVKWLPIFKDELLSDLIVESLNYCREKKGLLIHAWCIMPSHLHLILSCDIPQNLSSIVRDFKKFTSVSIVRQLQQNSHQKKYVDVFKDLGTKSKKNWKFKVWIDGYHPVELNTNYMLDQRLEYLHNNPVKSGLVESPEFYKYSSACDYYIDSKGLIQLDLIT